MDPIDSPSAPVSGKPSSKTRRAQHAIAHFVWLMFPIFTTVAAVATAATPVATLEIEAHSDYAVTRSYAGIVVPQRQSQLGFRHAGEVQSISVDLGDTVEPGDVLATLDADRLVAAVAQAQADLDHAGAGTEAARAHVSLARQTERRHRQLRESGHGSAQTHDEHRLALRAKEAELRVSHANQSRAEANLQSAQIALDDTRIVAPYRGTVQDRYVDEGTQIAPGQTALRIVETDHSEVHIGLPGQLINVLQPGNAYPVSWRGVALNARLKSVLPELDPETRTQTAVFELTESRAPLGATVELSLDRRLPGAGFWIPTTALAESARGLWSVLVVNDDAVLERRLVEIVHAEAEKVYVRGTLQNGERIVSTGVQRVVPGQRVELTTDTLALRPDRTAEST